MMTFRTRPMLRYGVGAMALCYDVVTMLENTDILKNAQSRKQLCSAPWNRPESNPIYKIDSSVARYTFSVYIGLLVGRCMAVDREFACILLMCI